MVLSRDGIETKVWLVPYEESSIDKSILLPASGKSMIIQSVKNYESTLVQIVLPGGQTVMAKADHLITAIQKCVM